MFALKLASALSVAALADAAAACNPGQIAATIDFETLKWKDTPYKLCFNKGISTPDASLASMENLCVALGTTEHPRHGKRNGNAGAMIFDATCGATPMHPMWKPHGRCRRDTDLHQAGQGNVLILQDNNGVMTPFDGSERMSPRPNDDRDGGCFQFDWGMDGFRGPMPAGGRPAMTSEFVNDFKQWFSKVDVKSVTLMDIEKRIPATIKVGKSDGTFFETTLDEGEDGGIQTLPLNVDDALGVQICLAGSGAVDDLQLCLDETEVRRLVVEQNKDEEQQSAATDDAAVVAETISV